MLKKSSKSMMGNIFFTFIIFNYISLQLKHHSPPMTYEDPDDGWYCLVAFVTGCIDNRIFH